MNYKELFAKSVYTRIKVIPSQSETRFRGLMDDGTIKIAVKSPPEKGKANKEVITFLAEQLSVRKDQIRITSGLTGRIKVIRLMDEKNS